MTIQWYKEIGQLSFLRLLSYFFIPLYCHSFVFCPISLYHCIVIPSSFVLFLYTIVLSFLRILFTVSSTPCHERVRTYTTLNPTIKWSQLWLPREEEYVGPYCRLLYDYYFVTKYLPNYFTIRIYSRY
jgi:hypothetical protein